MKYCHFDEFEDAVLSIELAAEKFQSVQTNPTSWKWVIIAMQNALQGAMVLALAGTDGCGALYPKSQKENRAWLQSPTPTRPRREMANFNTLLGWIQRPELLEGPAPKLSDEDCRNLKRLNELRRQFAHYNPTGWGVELQYMLNIMPAAANLFEHLTTTQGRPNLHFTMGHKRRMRKSLAAIRRLVAEKMKQSSQGLIYTILVDGKPIVALEASGREAAELCKEEWFRADLYALSSNGEPICGIGSKLQARPAIEEERIRYQEASKEAEASDDILFAYLIELDGTGEG